MAEDHRDEQEETYRKVDNRRAREEEQPPEPSAEEELPPEPSVEEERPPEPSVEEELEPEPEAASEPPPAEPPSDSPPSEEATQIDVYGVLRFAVSLLLQTAWMDLGIQAPPGGETHTDLPKAKVAIDALSDIVARLQPDMTLEEKKEMEGVLANLRINYVQRS